MARASESWKKNVFGRDQNQSPAEFESMETVPWYLILTVTAIRIFATRGLMSTDASRPNML